MPQTEIREKNAVNKRFTSNDLAATRRIGEKLAALLPFPACVYLTGQMGAGKTTLSQSIILALGYRGVVTSPTYNLIQEYPVAKGVIYHMDLYRLDDPAELEFLALSDLWGARSLFLIEWPENGLGYLQKPSHEISISKSRSAREIHFSCLT